MDAVEGTLPVGRHVGNAHIQLVGQHASDAGRNNSFDGKLHHQRRADGGGLMGYPFHEKVSLNLFLHSDMSIFGLQRVALQTVRPAVSRKKRGFSVRFGPGGAVPQPRVFTFFKGETL